MCTFIGLSILSDRVRQLNTQTRFAVDEDTWPPNQPQEFTPLLLVHQKGQQSFKQAITPQLAGSRYPQDIYCLQALRGELTNSKTTKQLVDILAPL